MNAGGSPRARGCHRRRSGPSPTGSGWTRIRSTSSWCRRPSCTSSAPTALPGRFSHWTHGRAYQQIKTQYDYGLSKIYELVINTNPAYAFLLENNTVLQNKLVAAHVLAHVDFFKNNTYFQHTNRSMLETVSINAERLRQLRVRARARRGRDAAGRGAVDRGAHRPEPAAASVRPRSRDAAAPGRRSPDHTVRRRLRLGEPPPEEPKEEVRRFPPEPEKDLLLFLAEHAPDLETWQRDVLHIVRAEQLYFLPQMQTKIMNEGWASLLARPDHARA